MSNKEYFPQRLRSARKMSGLTLDALSERISRRVTKQALNKYEQGAMYPDPDLLLPLCQALEVRPDYFTRQKRVVLAHYSFPKLARLSKKEQAMAIEKTRDALGRYLELEELHGLDTAFDCEFPRFPSAVRAHEDAEQAAEAIRAHYRLGEGPISNVVELLEEHGVRIVEIALNDAFTALSGLAGEDMPVIVLNSQSAGSLDQQRFSVLREWGRLLLPIHAGDDKETDRLCETFAGALLLPGGRISELLGARRSALIWNELVIIKELYGLPIRAILHRAKMHGIITAYDFTSKMAELSRFYGRNGEPGQYRSPEKALRFRRLLLRAVAEELVSLSKAAALSGMSLSDFREELKRENAGSSN